MNNQRWLSFFTVSLIVLGWANNSRADWQRTQTISLHPGWNSVFIEVDPNNPKPVDFFQGTPVTIAAAFTGADKTVQFVQDPSTNSITHNNGWDVWYAPTRVDGFLTSLFQIVGNKPYLLYAETNGTLVVNGNARLISTKWRPKSYNLAGFGLDPVSPPTFDQYFKGSAQHQPYQIYRLVNSVWTKVDNAAATQMQAGEAYWVFCKGASDFQGPLSAQLQSGQGLSLHGGNAVGLTLQNQTPNPLNVSVQNLGNGNRLPLAYILRAVTATNITKAAFDLPDAYQMPAFDAAEKRGFWLALRPERMNAAQQNGLLKITTDVGTVNWLPVAGSQAASTTTTAN